MPPQITSRKRESVSGADREATGHAAVLKNHQEKLELVSENKGNALCPLFSLCFLFFGGMRRDRVCDSCTAKIQKSNTHSRTVARVAGADLIPTVEGSGLHQGFGGFGVRDTRRSAVCLEFPNCESKNIEMVYFIGFESTNYSPRVMYEISLFQYQTNCCDHCQV